MMQNAVFPVCDKVYCVWGATTEERNEEFIRTIDAEYFDYVANTYALHLKGEEKLRAAMAIRANYYLCLETLFTLIGALLQSPHCVPGWFLKAQTGDIRSIVSGIQDEDLRYPVVWKPRPKPISWGFISAAVNGHVDWPGPAGETVEAFANMWSRLASDFLDELHIAEYNGIKHGMRTNSGGFSMRICLDDRPPGYDGPDTIDLGSCGFGSSFLVDEPLSGSTSRNDPNFSLRHHALNWKPDHVVNRTRLAAMSIRNIRSLLLLKLRYTKAEEVFFRPDELDDFTAPWLSDQCPLIHSSFDYHVTVAETLNPSRASIRQIIDKQWSQHSEF